MDRIGPCLALGYCRLPTQPCVCFGKLKESFIIKKFDPNARLGTAVWVKHFQAIHHSSVDVAHGLALLFGLGTKAVPSWDDDETIYRALNQLRPSGQSKWRPTPSLSQV